MYQKSCRNDEREDAASPESNVEEPQEQPVAGRWHGFQSISMSGVTVEWVVVVVVVFGLLVVVVVNHLDVDLNSRDVIAVKRISRINIESIFRDKYYDFVNIFSPKTVIIM
jgi:hypothetical protein